MKIVKEISRYKERLDALLGPGGQLGAGVSREQLAALEGGDEILQVPATGPVFGAFVYAFHRGQDPVEHYDLTWIRLIVYSTSTGQFKFSAAFEQSEAGVDAIYRLIHGPEADL